MILAALALLAVGGADLIRQFSSGRRRVIGFIAGAVALFVGAIVVDAAVWAIAALLVAALWVVLVAPDGRSRGGLWTVGLLGVLCGVAVVAAGPRVGTRALGDLWELPAPGQSVPVDVLVLTLGAAVFLLESANIVVRIALRAEHLQADGDTATVPASEGESTRVSVRDSGREAAVAMRQRPGLKGGRLIGPLERIIVFALTLAGAYTLIAAVFAAKGIVRFPEISRDDEENGSRAETFLIGSLVSWVIAFGAAFLVWWAAR